MSKVLIVEDDQRHYKKMAEPLEKEGFEVIEASNRQQANDILDDLNHGFELAIIDIHLDNTRSNRDGFHVARRIFKDEERRFPIILCSQNFSVDGYMEQAKKVGVTPRYFRDKALIDQPKALLGLVYDALNNFGVPVVGVDEYLRYQNRPIGISVGQGQPREFYHPNDILYLMSDGYATQIHIKQRDTPITRGYNLLKLQQQIRKYHKNFLRCGNQYVVNLNAVVKTNGHSIIFPPKSDGENRHIGLTPEGWNTFRDNSCFL